MVLQGTTFCCRSAPTAPTKGRWRAVLGWFLGYFWFLGPKTDVLGTGAAAPTKRAVLLHCSYKLLQRFLSEFSVK